MPLFREHQQKTFVMLRYLILTTKGVGGLSESAVKKGKFVTKICFQVKSNFISDIRIHNDK